MSAETKAIARRFLEEAFNGGNLDVVDELVAPEFVNHDAALPEPMVGITIDRIADGRFVESWTNWDTLGLMQQLGVVPALATA